MAQPQLATHLVQSEFAISIQSVPKADYLAFAWGQALQQVTDLRLQCLCDDDLFGRVGLIILQQFAQRQVIIADLGATSLAPEELAATVLAQHAHDAAAAR